MAIDPRRLLLQAVALSLAVCPALAAAPVTVAGRVLDADSQAPLTGANIAFSDTLGTFCDARGRFRLAVLPGAYELAVTMVGYGELRQQLSVPAQGLRDLVFRLRPQILPMGETVVAKQQLQLPTFTDVTERAGIDFRHVYGEGPLRTILQTTGAGVCFFDYDGDGFEDLYLVNGYAIDAPDGAPATNALYRNGGDGTFPGGDLRFIDYTAAAGVGDARFGMGCAAADYDADGDLDLYVTNYGPNILYRNEGDGTFTDVAARAGVADAAWGVGTAWADYDGDGDLDLFVGNYLDFALETPSARSLVSLREGFRLYPGPRDYDGLPDALYRNNGDGTFADVSAAVGLNPHLGKAMGCGFGDYDADGDQDLFVANDRTPNQLYRNDDGVFADVALWAGVAYNEAGNESGAMAVDFGDYDNDGLLDLLVTDFIFEYNALYRNGGDGSFADVSVQTGLAAPSFGMVAWGAGFFDYDSDGHLDIFVANGHVHENIDVLTEDLTFQEPNQLFHNEGDGSFTDVSTRSGAHFLGAEVSRGVAFADYDNDGDVDVLVLNIGTAPNLLRNDGGNRENWLCLRLVGTGDNRDAIGARAVVSAGPLTMVREVHSGSSYLSQNDLRLFFGLGSRDMAERIRVRWPGGQTDELENIPANRMLLIKAGGEYAELRPSAESGSN
ncbi:MAG: FG-GAP-like repeat-containing protein [Candidatus Latescibacteria bacterium]|jgi:hypothetical protein|nr:FG-GAP-like repeat-containing protein [Candidatus Latescibacterota bacterium]